MNENAPGADVLAEATGCSSIAEALAWIADDHPLGRSTRVGGDTTPGQLTKLSGCDKQLSLVVLDRKDKPAFGVIFSSACDSGTARKNASRLRAMKRPPGLPIAVIVAGPGWAARNETADLAADFEGRLYSERALVELTQQISETIKS